ncbi:MAG: IS110 family transposase [Acetobacter sp.]|jgi:transposase|nr:IS110 family transposase [Acetobacter sp.]MCH4061190.1 IS110 family transposase [Acetobacter sp.]MCH4088127.1 IS110 family transposase [Acetobacter sp.]
MTFRTIGIDLAIRGDHLAQIYDDGRPNGRAIRFRHDQPSLAAFVQAAVMGLRADDHIQAIMEPTGMSWFPVAHHLADAGVTVARVKGKRVKALRRYLSEHAKTDMADAQILAAIPSFGGPRLDPVHIPDPRSHALQRLTKQRSRFQNEIADARRRLLDLIRWASPRLEAVLPDLGTRLSLALLQKWFHPSDVLKARRTTLAKYVAAHAGGNHPRSGPFVETLITGLREAAQYAQNLHGAHIDFSELQFEIATEIENVLKKIQIVGDLEQHIADLYKHLDPQALLLSIPGVGRHLAPTLIGILQNIERFHSEKHLRGFCGLFPRRADSGGVERAGQTLTQGGNNRIKHALYLAADTARKIDPELAELYWRLMTVKGHHHKQALCAVANRIVNRIFSVLKRGKPYEMRDREGNSITLCEAKAIILERYTVGENIRTGRRSNRIEKNS